MGGLPAPYEPVCRADLDRHPVARRPPQAGADAGAGSDGGPDTHVAAGSHRGLAPLSPGHVIPAMQQEAAGHMDVALGELDGDEAGESDAD